MTAPYDVQVDLMSQTSRCRNNSAESSTTKLNNASGSPVSGCSALISGSEESRLVKCRKLCKRHGSNEKSYEQSSVHFADQVSLQNYTSNDIVSNSISEDSDTYLGYVPLNSESAEGSCFTSRCSELKSGIPPCQSRFQDSNASSLPEVEVDRPSLNERHNSRKAVSTSALPLSHYTNSHNNKNLCKSKSQEDCALSEKIRRVRHRSCELAMENGRISPDSQL